MIWLCQDSWVPRHRDPAWPPRSSSPGELPPDGTPVVDGIPLPLGRRHPSENPFFWTTDEPADDPSGLAGALAGAFEQTGLWPLLWESSHEPPSNYYLTQPGQAALIELPAPGVLRVAWESGLSSIDQRSTELDGRTLGPFPGLAPASVAVMDPSAIADIFRDLGYQDEWRAHPQLVVVPCRRPADALAALGWDYSQLPAPVWTSVLRSWEDRFAAITVGFEPSAIRVRVCAPPTDMAQAALLAGEIAAIAEGGLSPGQPLDATAAMLLTGERRSYEGPVADIVQRRDLWFFAFREYGTDDLAALVPAE